MVRGVKLTPPGLLCKYFDVGLARVKIWSRMKNHVSHVKMDVTSLKMGLRFRQAVLDIWSNKQKNPMRGFVDLLTPCRTYLFFCKIKIQGGWTLLWVSVSHIIAWNCFLFTVLIDKSLESSCDNGHFDYSNLPVNCIPMKIKNKHETVELRLQNHQYWIALDSYRAKSTTWVTQKF